MDTLLASEKQDNFANRISQKGVNLTTFNEKSQQCVMVQYLCITPVEYGHDIHNKSKHPSSAIAGGKISAR